MDAVPFHVGITTGDLHASMAELGDHLQVTWSEPSARAEVFHTVDGVPQPRPLSCVSNEGPIHVDLIQGAPGTIWHTDAGPRLHHFAYWTDDLAGDIDHLATQGWRLELTRPDSEGRPTQFAYLVRDDGFRLELVDAVGRADYDSRLTGQS